MKDLLPGDLDLVELSNKELEDYEIPEVISAKDIKEKEHANRLFAQETDDYSIVYQNKDGSKTMYYFDEPVKYTDETELCVIKAQSCLNRTKTVMHL